MRVQHPGSKPGGLIQTATPTCTELRPPAKIEILAVSQGLSDPKIKQTFSKYPEATPCTINPEV